MAFEELPEPTDVDTPLPDHIETFLVDADGFISDYYTHHPDRPIGGFVPSDYPSIYRTLSGLIHMGFDPGQFLEWGSGFGVVAGMASYLGYDAHGIEIEAELIDQAQELLDENDLTVQLHHGSYVPTGFDETETFGDEGVVTIVPGPPAYDEMGLDIADFDVVFVFPWPGTESLHFNIFERFASPGAILISHHGVSGNWTQRKISR